MCRPTPLRFAVTSGSLAKPVNHSLNQSHGLVLQGGLNVIVYVIEPRSEAHFVWIFANYSTQTIKSLLLCSSAPPYGCWYFCFHMFCVPWVCSSLFSSVCVCVPPGGHRGRTQPSWSCRTPTSCPSAASAPCSDLHTQPQREHDNHHSFTTSAAISSSCHHLHLHLHAFKTSRQTGDATCL